MEQKTPLWLDDLVQVYAQVKHDDREMINIFKKMQENVRYLALSEKKLPPIFAYSSFVDEQIRQKTQ